MLSIAFLIIVVVDPFGNIPMVNSLVSQAKVEDRQKILLRESLFASLILLLSALVGQTLLDALSLTSHSLSISGGIVLFVITLGMLFPKNKMLDDEVEADPFIFPIAIERLMGMLLILISVQMILDGIQTYIQVL